jgi:hypothetical protein
MGAHGAYSQKRRFSARAVGLDLRDSAAVDFAWPIITNRAALAVNRAWPASPDGSGPGRLVATDGAWVAGRIDTITRQVWKIEFTGLTQALGQL